MTRRWPAALILVPLLAVPSAASAGARAIPPAGHSTLLPARPLTNVRPARGPFVHRLRVQNEANYRALKQRANRVAERSGALGPGQLAPPPKAAVFGGLNAPGLSAGDNSATPTPPDTTGSIGPTAYVQFVNSVVAEFSRSNLSIVGAPVQLDAFEGETGFNVFDVQIQWDQSAGRWFYVNDDCIDSSCSQDSGLDIGWSKTADPAAMNPAQWCNFFLPSDAPGGTLFDDYPKLGHDDNHLLISGNTFDGSTFKTARLYVIAKPPPGDETACPAASSVGVTTFGSTTTPITVPSGDRAVTLEPANIADASGSGFAVAADDPTGDTPGAKSHLTLWQIGGSGTAPTFTRLGAVPVSSFDVPAAVPQPGALSDTLDSLDSRLTQAVGHADPDAGGAEAVWTQHTIAGPGGRSVDRWYELIPSTLTVRQQGTISDPSNFVFNGAISPADNGHDAAVQYNLGSSSLLVQVHGQSRKYTAPLSTMNGDVTLATSADIDQDFSCTMGPSCRWGDYAGANPDPVAPDLVWGTNQTNGPVPIDPTDPAWRTQIFSLTANQRPTAAIAGAPNPVVAGAAVTFSAGGSVDPDGTIVDHLWDLDGNGTFETDTGAAPTVSHVYGGAGGITVALRVVDDEGGTADAATPLTVLAPPPPDKTAPHVRLKFKRVQKLRAVLAHGLKGSASCDEPCRTTFQVVLTGKVAKRFHIARTVGIGKKSVSLAPGVQKKVTIKLGKRARKRLRRARRVPIALKVSAKDAAGNVRRETLNFVLKR